MSGRKEESGGHGEEREPALPADEEAAWAQIVAAYGEEPRIPPDGGPDEGLAGEGRSDDGSTDGGSADETPADGSPAGEDRDGEGADGPRPGSGPAAPSRSFTVYAAGTGPRDWQAPDDEDDEHFVPPEPPPLPEADVTTKLGWIAALGGPLLLIGAVLFDVYLSWWILTLGVGGFLGGFATLLTRLRDGHDDLDDPGGGAVV